jgi:hypothetical protein
MYPPERTDVFRSAHSFYVVLISCFSGFDVLLLVESICIPESQVRIARIAASHGNIGPWSVVSETIKDIPLQSIYSTFRVRHESH